MAKAAHPLVEFLADQLRDWAPVTARRLFGGWGLYHGSTMFGLIARDTIFFRTDDRNRRDYDDAGVSPFRYAGRNGRDVDLPYAEVPAAVLEDPDELARWADKAHGAALRAAIAKHAVRKSRAASRAGAR